MLSRMPYLLLWLIVLAAPLVSCSSVRNQRVAAVQSSQQTSGGVVIDKSGQTYVNQHKIVVGLNADDFSYRRVTTIIKGKGRELEVVRDCSAIAAIRLNGDMQDTSSKVNKVTIINRDTIEIHTKAMVEKYRHEIKNQANPDRPYQYLRFLGMMSEGEGNMLVNEGVIIIVFDHDPSADFRVYGFGLCGNANSTFINRGLIKFGGMGSPLTRMRGMGSMADNVSFINEGTINIDVQMSEDARMITSGGEYNEIINNGTMLGRSSGTLLGMTRYGDSHIVNNGTIDLSVVKMPDGYKSILAGSEKFVCGMMELMSSKCTHIPPMGNKGVINITLDGLDDTDWTGYGMYVGMVSPCRTNMSVNNDGTIGLAQRGSNVKHQMAEMGIFSRVMGDSPISITIGNWRTHLRDFKKKEEHLFVSNCAVKMDFSKANVHLLQGKDGADGKVWSVSPDVLLTNPSGKSTVEGYEKIGFAAALDGFNMNWNKAGKTISLTKKTN
ncbi:MAG: hypothetical protein IKP73_14980 [Bacteroidales bacterium]|nr:hypothetical protein [Bacteroidales bacterium]